MIKTYKITVNGKSYDVTVEETDNVAQAVQTATAKAAYVAPQTVKQPEQPAATATSAPKSVAAGAVKAPMPGKVMKLAVSAGEQVKAGQLLLILEAMKMENEIFAPVSGTVTEIISSAGDNVNTGDSLLVIA